MRHFLLSVSVFITAFVGAGPGYGDQVFNEGAVIQGNSCVGFDCVDNETFNDAALKFKENNTRIRFHDTSSTALMGQSWYIEANNSLNGGADYFRVNVKSVDEIQAVISDGSFQLSDGTAPEYDCTAHSDRSNPQPAPPPTTGNTIPAGERIVNVVTHLTPIFGYTCGEVPNYPLYDCSQTNPLYPRPVESIPAGDQATLPEAVDPDAGDFTCKLSFDYQMTTQLHAGPVLENTLALGLGSEPVADAVSIGKTDLLRQLKNVAEGVQETDLLIKKTLDDYSAFADQALAITHITQSLETINQQLDDIEAQLTFKEDQAPSAPKLVSPSRGASRLNPNSILFRWRPAQDPEGKSLTYTLTICEREDFQGCDPRVVTAPVREFGIALWVEAWRPMWPVCLFPPSGAAAGRLGLWPFW